MWHLDWTEGPGRSEDGGVMNEARSPYMVTCPKCGERIRAETASLMAADYWQHLDGEHGIKRDIVPLRHVG